MTYTEEQLIADIHHAEEKAMFLCGECAKDHARLAFWLRSLLSDRIIKWTSVDDDLPPVGAMVEVYMHEPVHSETNYAICRFTKYGFDRSKVTHWKYLSSPPVK